MIKKRLTPGECCFLRHNLCRRYAPSMNPDDVAPSPVPPPPNLPYVSNLARSVQGRPLVFRRGSNGWAVGLVGKGKERGEQGGGAGGLQNRHVITGTLFLGLGSSRLPRTLTA